MKILYCRKLETTKVRDAVAFVDVQIDENFRLYGLRLIRQPDGGYHLYAPQAGTRRVATFSEPMAKRLTALAVEALEAA